MAPDTYFMMTSAFALSCASTVAIAATARSRWRFITPFTVVLSLGVVYFGLDAATGTAKPVGIIPGWTEPNLKGDGAAVLSATPFGDKQVILTLQEGKDAEPRLYRMPATDELMDGLKRAMERHAAANKGEKFGFTMREGQASGSPAHGARNGTPGDRQGGSEARDAPQTPYRFSEPDQASLPPKD